MKKTQIFGMEIAAWQKSTLLVLGGILLMFASSQVTIPLKPVPVTLQTLGLMLIALTYEKREAILSMVGYVVAGTIGIPVFAGFSFGPAVILGPTGGYLLGFIAATVLMANLKELWGLQKASLILLNCLLGTAVIYLLGVPWLAYFVGWEAAFTGGFLPFIPSGFAKAIALSLIIRGYLTVKKS